jgi:2,4-dienoyl-CoA reductase-like NADH-dependent reductase (Old Yellow Enzyme family)
MYEHLAPLQGGHPQQLHYNLYKEWSKGCWGMILTGNIQIQQDHLSLGRDIVIPSFKNMRYKKNVDAFRNLSECIHGEHADSTHPLAIMQLNHTGRQSPRFIGGRPPWRKPVAPSSIPLGFGKNSRENWFFRLIYRLMFQQPNALSEDGIEKIILKFREAALLAHETGFDGIQLHASHGCKSHIVLHVTVL